MAAAISAGMELRPAPGMALHASPALVAFAAFLQLPAAELETRVEQELAENPALEQDETPPSCPLCGEPLGPAGWCPCMAGDGARTAPVGPLPDPPQPDGGADRLVAELRAALPTSDGPLAEYLVGSLDERGRLDLSDEEIAAALRVGVRRVRHVREVLCRVAPPGTGARDVRECLLLQLDHWEETHGIRRPEVRAMIQNRLADLADARRAATDAGVGEARAFVRAHLSPRPAIELSPPAAAGSVPPDLVITRHRGEEGAAGHTAYVVTLLEPSRIRLCLSPAYLMVLDDGGDDGGGEGGHGAARLQIARAQQFLTRLEQRWRTLRQVAEYLADAQRPFLDGGPALLRPLRHRDVADALGLHESTVSRAVAGRVALLPSHRAMPLSGFFDASLGARTALRHLVEHETHPLSDGELARLLTDQGFPTARRTVAKYRSCLGIPPCHRRTPVAPAR